MLNTAANNAYSPCLSIHENLDTFILSKFRVTHSGRKTAQAIYENRSMPLLTIELFGRFQIYLDICLND